MLTHEQQERVRLLVTALRSGKYRQGKYSLVRYDAKAKKKKYCCLGVACEVARLGGLELSVRSEEGLVSYDNHDSTLPESVQDWYGFDRTDPLLIFDDDLECASHLNDRMEGLKFGQIADAFERTYLSPSASASS